MALTPSEMTPLGTPMPDFALTDVIGGREVRAAELAGKRGLLVMFICAHCPYVVHVEPELARLVRDHADSELGIVAISANDAETHPEDAPAGLRAQAERIGLACPYLHDESQDVAEAFHAACTPDFFLYDGERKLFYRGQLDDSRPGKDGEPNGRDLRAAIAALLAGEEPPAEQKPSLGCNVKWKPGRGP